MQPERSLSEDAVRVRAYQLWIEEGRPEGRHDIHWQRALASLTPPALISGDAPTTVLTPAVVKAKAARGKVAKSRSK